MQNIHTADGRRVMPVVVRTAAIVLIAGSEVFALAACSGARVASIPQTPAHTSSRTIPFRAIPAAKQVLELPAAALGIASCTAPDLSAVTDTGGGAGGSWVVPVTISNNGAQCALPLTTTDFGFVGTDGVHHTFGGVQPAQSNDTSPTLEPGATLRLSTALPEQCNSGSGQTGNVATYLTVGGATVSLSGAQISAEIAICGEGGSQQVAQVDNGGPIGDLSPLSVSLDAPKTIAAGQTLTYNVTLTNSGTKPIPLKSCPSYLEQVNVRGTISKATYQLNCGSIGQIAAKRSVTFQMKIPVPSSRFGPAKLSWALSGGNATGAVTNVTK